MLLLWAVCIYPIRNPSDEDSALPIGVTTNFIALVFGKFFEVNVYSPVRGQFACIVVDVTERRRDSR